MTIEDLEVELRRYVKGRGWSRGEETALLEMLETAHTLGFVAGQEEEIKRQMEKRPKAWVVPQSAEDRRRYEEHRAIVKEMVRKLYPQGAGES